MRLGLARRIRLKEREIEQARLALRQSTDEFRRVLRERLASRTALAVGFAGGLLLGWQQRRRRRAKRSRSAAAKGDGTRLKRAAGGLPPHWLRSYVVWPFLLATARDALVSRRPTR